MTTADAGAAAADRERLLARLRAAGVDDEEIERAAAEERLPTLAVELALGGAGRRRQIGFAIEDGHHVGGLTHFDLLNHPAVYDQIRAWVQR